MEMKRLTIEAIHSQLPRHVALDILQLDSSGSPERFARALESWLRLHVTVIDEFEEVLISPKIMISEIWKHGRTAGDCDDLAMLAAALLASAGAETAFVATGELQDGSFSHVFAVYRFPNREEWNPIDVTVPIPRKLEGNYLFEEIKS
ncbi:MAG: transglutaminase domain-containing protein [Candidatus Omnitrophota bacterium]|jgi:transglutaminase-like putative cysteine protease